MTMLSRDRSITFAPSNGVLVLHGTVASDGSVHAALNSIGAEHHPFPLVFEGKLEDAGISGTYTTPICRAHVELQPPKPLRRTLFSPGNILGVGNP